MRTLFIIVATLFTLNAQASGKSPFTDVFFNTAPSIGVVVNGTNYFLLNVDGIKRADIMAKCEAKYATACTCMFAENFSTMMTEIGHPINDTVTLGLYLMETHQVLSVNAPATEANTEETIINRMLRNEACN